MMLPKFLSLSLWCVILISVNGLADTLILKDGTEIKGDIIEDQTNAVVIEYSVTPTIKDQKTVPRDSIAKVITAPDDEKAYAELGSRETPPVVVDTSFYDSFIDKKIPTFIRQYPYTSHISELREDLRRLTSERDRVLKGDRRIDGTWITAEQIAADPYQMAAKVSFNQMKESALKKDVVSSLKEYELFEPAYPNSRVMPDAVDLALTEMAILQQELSTAQDNFDVLAARRQQAIASVPADQAQAIKDSVDRENQSARDAIAKANQDGTKFYPVFPNTKEALDSLQSVLTSETERLKRLQEQPMRDSLKATADASELIAVGKFAEAKTQLDNASQDWSPNAEILTLRKKLDAAVKAAAATNKP